MLLFQWGIFDFGQGETFHYDITRQFVVSGSSGDDGMSQLSLTVHFGVSNALRGVDGNRWCKSLANAVEFERFINASEATRAVEGLKPLRVTLDWGEV
jgi:hypothetical protein